MQYIYDKTWDQYKKVDVHPVQGIPAIASTSKSHSWLQTTNFIQCFYGQSIHTQSIWHIYDTNKYFLWNKWMYRQLFGSCNLSVFFLRLLIFWLQQLWQLLGIWHQLWQAKTQITLDSRQIVEGVYSQTPLPNKAAQLQVEWVTYCEWLWTTCCIQFLLMLSIL
jgi:hypothetical protein